MHGAVALPIKVQKKGNILFIGVNRVKKRLECLFLLLKVIKEEVHLPMGTATVKVIHNHSIYCTSYIIYNLHFKNICLMLIIILDMQKVSLAPLNGACCIQCLCMHALSTFYQITLHLIIPFFVILVHNFSPCLFLVFLVPFVILFIL